MKQWYFYLLQNNKCTYAGVSVDPVRRLRQHNKELKGGAKYTTSKSSDWTHLCIIQGFRTKIEALQFEWAVKHTKELKEVEFKKNYIKSAVKKNGPQNHLWQKIPLVIQWFVPIPKDHNPSQLYL